MLFVLDEFSWKKKIDYQLAFAQLLMQLWSSKLLTFVTGRFLWPTGIWAIGFQILQYLFTLTSGSSKHSGEPWAGERCWLGEMASYLTVIACFTTLLTWNIAENTNNVVLVAFFQGKRFSNPQEFNVLLKLKERVVKIIYFLVSTWDSTHIYTKHVRNGLFSDIFMLKNVN